MRTYLSLFISNLFLIAGTGLLSTYLPLFLSKSGQSTEFIGVLTSSYYIGLLVGSKVGFYVIASIGHIRTFATSMAILIICVVLHGIVEFPLVWLVFRFVVGISMMCNYMVLESWLNDQATEENRGAIFSYYMIASYLGMMFGQHSISIYPELGMQPIFLICLFLAMAIVPISSMSKIHSEYVEPLKVSFFEYLRKAPQSLSAIFFAGVINGSFYGLAPIFVQKLGFETEKVALFMFVTVLGGFLAQWPMGLLSDNFRRSILLRVNACSLFIISILFVFTPIDFDLFLVLTFLFGIFSFTIHPLSAALANSRVSDRERVGVAAALLFSFGVGASLGATVISNIMTNVGAMSLYYSYSVLAIIMFLVLSIIDAKQQKENPAPTDYAIAPSDVNHSPIIAGILQKKD